MRKSRSGLIAVSIILSVFVICMLLTGCAAPIGKHGRVEVTEQPQHIENPLGVIAAFVLAFAAAAFLAWLVDWFKKED